MTLRFDRHAIAAIVLDIEGTTTPMAFVYEVLFPFARRWLRPFLRDMRTSPLLGEITDGLREEWMHEGSGRDSPPPWPEDPGTQSIAVAAYVEWLMDRDRKSPALKLLQGHIWRRGYESGELRSELFADVAPAIRRWRASGVKVAIYSSGSVLAQRLLFGHTPDGDLTPEVDGFFDTTVGPKTSSASYQRIAAALECSAAALLFVSDSTKELDAASEAGCRVVLCVRPGNVPLPADASFDVIHNFEALVIAG